MTLIPGTAPPIQSDNYGPSQFGPKVFYLLENDLLGGVQNGTSPPSGPLMPSLKQSMERALGCKRVHEPHVGLVWEPGATARSPAD
jgi:hypothetical protein